MQLTDQQEENLYENSLLGTDYLYKAGEIPSIEGKTDEEIEEQDTWAREYVIENLKLVPVACIREMKDEDFKKVDWRSVDQCWRQAQIDERQAQIDATDNKFRAIQEQLEDLYRKSLYLYQHSKDKNI